MNMNKKIAIPVDENGILEGHFGHSNFFALISVTGQNIVAEERLTPPPHEPGVFPKWLIGHGVTDILAGGMGQRAINILQNEGVNVFTGAPKQTTKELVTSFLNKTIEFSPKNCEHHH